MIKSTVGALLGFVTLIGLVLIVGLALDALAFDRSLLAVVGVSGVAGAVLGWLRPGLFIKTLLFFLEPSVFD